MIFLKKLIIYLFERGGGERETAWEGGAEREKEAQTDSARQVWSPLQGSIPQPWDQTRAKTKSQVSNQLCHPGPLLNEFLKICITFCFLERTGKV